MDEGMLEKLIVAETPDDVQVIVKEYDINMSDEDAEQLLSELEEIRTSAMEGEMNDEELDAVVGGFSLSGLWDKTKSFIKQHKDSIISAYIGPMERAALGWKSSEE